MDREAALKKAAELAAEFEIGPQNYKQAAAFRNDNRFQNFVELEGGGLEKFTEILEKGYYHSYHWSVRHFEEFNAHELIFWFKPNGEIYGFYEKIPELEKGAALSPDEARQIAEHHAIYNWNVDLFPYELVEHSKEKQISGRVDHKFVYERTDIQIGDAKYRLTLLVCGNQLSAVNYTVNIPENFDRRYSEMRSANNTIQNISTGIIGLIYGLLGVVLAIFILIRSNQLIWKPAIYWGLGIAFFSVFLLTINSLPFSWFSYDTSSSESNFLFRVLFNGLSGAIGFGAVIALSFMAAEGLGRMAFPKHIQWWEIWSGNVAGSLPVLKQTLAGYLFAIIILAFDVFFYVTTTQHFDWWSPAGILSNPNILATYLPWLDSIAISVQAGFWEEALFRAVPIAGIFILTKNNKYQKLWVLLVLFSQTLIFGAAHASYPQQPSYARVLEMIVPFFIMGVIYIYFGILPAVIAHFSVDVFWISLPLWVSSSNGIWFDRIMVVFFLFLPLLLVLFFRLKNKKWKLVASKFLNSGWQKTPGKQEFAEEVEQAAVPEKNYTKWLLPMGIIGFVLWLIFTPFENNAPLLELSKKEAVRIAQQEIKDRYNAHSEDWAILTSVADKIDTRDIFVWREGGKEMYDSLLSNFLAPPHWKIRWVKTQGKAEEKTEEFEIQVLNSGKILGVFHKIPEKREGKNLTQKQAQVLVDSVFLSVYNLNRARLKEISVSPTKQENRTDWEFIYADTISFPMEKGQGRYLVNIAGNEINKTHSYIYIPEEWIREYKNKNNTVSIVTTLASILLFGTLFFGVVLAIVRWTHKKFKLKLFVTIGVIFMFLFTAEIVLNWSSILAEYSTELPMKNYLVSVIIGIVMSGLFFALANGIFLGASPGWFPVNKKVTTKIYHALLLSLYIGGMLSFSKTFIPQLEPNWLSFEFLNGKLPWLLLAIKNSLYILILPAFVFLLFLGIHKFTNAWTQSRWIGFLFALGTGIAYSALSYKTLASCLISGIITGSLLLLGYLYFGRFNFEIVPLGFGLAPFFQFIKEAIILNSVSTYLACMLSLIIAISILAYWQNSIKKFPVK